MNPVEALYTQLSDYCPQITEQEFSERLVHVSSDFPDVSVYLVPFLAYMSFVPDTYPSDLKPDLVHIYGADAPLTSQQIDLIFEDLMDEDISGPAVIPYLVEVFRDVIDEIKKQFH